MDGILGLLNFLLMIFVMLGGILLFYLGAPKFFAAIKKAEEKRLRSQFNTNKKDEIKRVEKLLNDNNIPLPQNNDDSYRYMKIMINLAYNHYRNILIATLKSNGYNTKFKLNEFATCYYNKHSLLVFREVFFDSLDPTGTKETLYTHTGENGMPVSQTFDGILDLFKKMESTNATDLLAVRIPLNELMWYVEYPESLRAQVNKSVGAGFAVMNSMGGIAGAAAMDIAKISSAYDKFNNVEIYLGQVNSFKWSIAKGKLGCEIIFKELYTHFPNNRYQDTFKRNC